MANPARPIVESRTRHPVTCCRCGLPVQIEYSQFGNYRELTADAGGFHYQECQAEQRSRAEAKAEAEARAK